MIQNDLERLQVLMRAFAALPDLKAAPETCQHRLAWISCVHPG
jgi:hypothetical protein